MEEPDFREARFTSAFRNQLDALTLQRVINPFAVLDEIRAIEGNGRRQSRTKAPTSFKGGLLHGLKHKHFFNARHIAKNLQNYWNQDTDKAKNAINKIVTRHSSDDLWTLSGEIASRYVHEAFEHKNLSRSLTGDWIIYKRHNGRNYYLCLAGHEETEESIYNRIAGSAEAEFPELGIRVCCAQPSLPADVPASGGHAAEAGPEKIRRHHGS